MENPIFGPYFICFGPDTNIEIIVVNCPYTGNYQRLTNTVQSFSNGNYTIVTHFQRYKL